MEAAAERGSPDAAAAEDARDLGDVHAAGAHPAAAAVAGHPGGAIQGELSKWTNYVNGWQPRWFVFAGGILSYYASREDISQGCRGSINMVSATVSVHPTDNLRFDVVAADEQHLFLRALTAADRQGWIISLASAKLQHAPELPHHERRQTDADMELNLDYPLVNAIRSIKDTRRQLVKQLTAIEARVRTMAENKTGAEVTRDNAARLGRDAERMSDSCTQLIRTLKDLSRLTPHVYDEDVDDERPPGRHAGRAGGLSPLPAGISLPTGIPSKPPPLVRRASPRYGHLVTSPRVSQSASPPAWEQTKGTAATSPLSPTPVAGGPSTSSSTAPPVTATTPPPEAARASPTAAPGAASPSKTPPRMAGGAAPLLVHGSPPEPAEPPREPTPEPPRESEDETFFSQLELKFADVPIDAAEGNGIPTERFLAATRQLLPFLDRLGSTTFAPVKSDINGNITKLDTRYKSNPIRFSTLQRMIMAEIEE